MPAESAGPAPPVVLDAPTPAERVAFVPPGTFAVPFDGTGPMIERPPAAAGQLAGRARRRVKASAGAPGAEPAFPRPRSEEGPVRRVTVAFPAATRGGGFDALVALLHPGVVLRADKAAGPTPAPLVGHGAPTVAKDATAATERARSAGPALAGGAVGRVTAFRGRLFPVPGFTITGDRTTGTDVIAVPDRLRRLDLAAPDD
ncbi:hypothetical protein [Streptomyces enissocaesilis]|uniref:Uncharacterized protein n=1 Tax=Streptomyces enissocaesilis TaxID=332589 RepID=A0ABP6JA27_9ACTN